MPDGGFANEAAMTVVTTATAAAVCVLHLQRPSSIRRAGWLLEHAHQLGGFTAITFAGSTGIPDLLSTATALHALSLAGVSVGDRREKHLDYLDSLWSPQGGFRGHAADEVVDCEYTYYGLLSLGSLVL
jgi:prenyltransferase beta subunit